MKKIERRKGKISSTFPPLTTDGREVFSLIEEQTEKNSIVVYLR